MTTQQFNSNFSKAHTTLFKQALSLVFNNIYANDLLNYQLSQMNESGQYWNQTIICTNGQMTNIDALPLSQDEMLSLDYDIQLERMTACVKEQVESVMNSRLGYGTLEECLELYEKYVEIMLKNIDELSSK